MLSPRPNSGIIDFRVIPGFIEDPMLDTATLRSIAAARFEDAQILFGNSRYDGARYICGYAIELTLKARICDTLHWPSYPETSGDFKDLASFKVHNLNVLLKLSGRGEFVIQNSFANWSIVKDWTPEIRYKPIGWVSQADAKAFLLAVSALLQQI